MLGTLAQLSRCRRCTTSFLLYYLVETVGSLVHRALCWFSVYSSSARAAGGVSTQGAYVGPGGSGVLNVLMFLLDWLMLLFDNVAQHCSCYRHQQRLKQRSLCVKHGAHFSQTSLLRPLLSERLLWASCSSTCSTSFCTFAALTFFATLTSRLFIYLRLTICSDLSYHGKHLRQWGHSQPLSDEINCHPIRGA